MSLKEFIIIIIIIIIITLLPLCASSSRAPVSAGISSASQVHNFSNAAHYLLSSPILQTYDFPYISSLQRYHHTTSFLYINLNVTLNVLLSLSSQNLLSISSISLTSIPTALTHT